MGHIARNIDKHVPTLLVKVPYHSAKAPQKKKPSSMLGKPIQLECALHPHGG
jgi:hypothetical protein